ncbi:kinase-like protein [Ceratobasidium sp. AG-I]|nr:kinase-like protein [Ceratobasidium sp. AG-I]
MSSLRPPRGRGTMPAWATKGPDLSYIGAVTRYVSDLSLSKSTIPHDIESRIGLLLDKIATGQLKDRENYQVVAYASALEKEEDGTLLSLVLDLVFRTLYKYDSGGAVAATCAELCELLIQEILPNVQDGATRDLTGQPIKGPRLVRQYLLERCDSEISTIWTTREAALVLSTATPEDSAARAAAADAVERWINLARFIGYLHSSRLIPPSIIHKCIEKLVSGFNPTKGEAEAICRLIKDAAEPSGAIAQMDAHYLRIYQMVNNGNLDPQVKFILQTWIHPWQLSNGDTLYFNQPLQSSGGLRTAPAILSADPYSLIDAKDIQPIKAAPRNISPTEALPPSEVTEDTFAITASTPLDLVIAFFQKVTRLADYTSQLDQADCSPQPLAEGGSSEVYRATLRNNTRLAVKCMRASHVTGDSKVVKRTARELDVWSKLRHENILELLGLALFKGRLAMISTWMELGNIVMVVNNRPSMNRYKLCIQVVGAVVYLHGMEVVHGDLKGANVLVSHDGKPKLADFGLTITQESKLRLSVTEPAGGTMRWMAPEMFRREGRRSPEADMYALGMTMLETLTGKEPFSDVENSWSIPKMVLERQTPDRPEYLSVRSPVNDGFWMAMEKCWRYEPGDRARAVDVEEVLVAAERLAG